VVDIGYVLARPFWGRGLMPEAIRGLVKATFEAPTLYRIQATCDVENTGSFRALEKAGLFVRVALSATPCIRTSLQSHARAIYSRRANAAP
jgi:RimJ/RimL family protein N-acetyltransferase